MDIGSVERRREQVLDAMRGIRAMRPGAVSEQVLKIRLKGKKGPVERGPYFLWQYYEGGKPVRQRLKSPDAIERARNEVACHKRFLELCREFQELTGQLGQLEHDKDAADEAGKKSPKSRRKSRPRRGVVHRAGGVRGRTQRGGVGGGAARTDPGSGRQGGLGESMSSAGRAQRDVDVLCRKCHVPMGGTGPREKAILTILGPTPLPNFRGYGFQGEESLRHFAFSEKSLDYILIDLGLVGRGRLGLSSRMAR